MGALEHDEWVAAGCPGARCRMREVMAGLLGSDR